MHFKKNVSRAIVLLCVLASLLSLLPLGASGISYDGSGISGNGTANQTGNGAYGLYDTNLERVRTLEQR